MQFSKLSLTRLPAAPTLRVMPKLREALYGKGHLHLIACTCYPPPGSGGSEPNRSRSRSDHCADLGSGDGRCRALLHAQTGDQLLLSVRRRTKLGRQGDADALSKQRYKHIQRVLVEAAKPAPRLSPELAMVHEKEKQKDNSNRATLAVARKMVAYLLAVDRQHREFIPAEQRRSRAA